jgi:hypothetical protein
MKRSKKLNWLIAGLLFLGSSTASFAQTLKDVFNNSESPLTYLGIDFSKARLLDVGNADDIRNRLYASINNLIIDEPKKFDLKGAFKKSDISSDLSAVTKNNAKVNLNDIISTNQADFNRLKESDISDIVKALDISGKSGVGVLFVMEAMRKLDKKGDAAIWVTFVDMKTKKVLMTERLEENAKTAFGFRNYWASTIKELIDDIDGKKYKEWRNKVNSGS